MLSEKFATQLLLLPRSAKRKLAMAVDGSLCVFSTWLVLCLKSERFVALTSSYLWPAMAAVVLALPIFASTGLYRTLLRYSDRAVLVLIARAVALYGVVYGILFTGVGLSGVPRSLGLAQPLMLLLAVGGFRMLARQWLTSSLRSQSHHVELPRVMIYGAGDAGSQLARAMANSGDMRVVGFLDDDTQLRGSILAGLPIHDSQDLAALVQTLQISGVLLAIPSASQRRRREILQSIKELRLWARALPRLSELANGKVQATDLQEIDVVDLLGRDVVATEQTLLRRNINGKVVLVTGAGGSIGSELCRQIAQAAPAQLLLAECSEYALYIVHRSLTRLMDESGSSMAERLVPLLASIGDETRMRSIMQTWKPDTVYHAAAYKHVPLVEHNPAEGVRNNVFGTLVVAQMAAEYGVRDFVLVSTDKAVRPTSTMGASKRLAEMVVQAMAQRQVGTNGTRFSIVRFGNVLDSSGSVVPLFRQQIRQGGPITLTHAEVTRYFMTIPEAVQLVIEAGAMAAGGEVFVLDMGEPVRIADLARRMIELSGLTIRDSEHLDGDIEIRTVGLRPGEKLYEELLIGDGALPTAHPRIMAAFESFMPWSELSAHLEQLKASLKANDAAMIRLQLQRIVSNYQPDGEVVDWVYLMAQRRSVTTRAQAVIESISV